MRKAAGTTLAENLCRCCQPRACKSRPVKHHGSIRATHFTPFYTPEFGLYDWRRHPDASRVTSLRPPLERLASSYLYEFGIKHCWTDVPIDLTGDGRHEPSWTRLNKTFVESCFARYAKLVPLRHFVETILGRRGRGYIPNYFERPSSLGYIPNYYLNRLIRGEGAPTHSCGQINEGYITSDTPDLSCFVQHAKRTLLTMFDVVVLFHNHSIITLRSRRDDMPCCLNQVLWPSLETYTANGNIHRSGWFDTRISSLTTLLAAGIPHVNPEEWSTLVRINAADTQLWNSLLSEALAVPQCAP